MNEQRLIELEIKISHQQIAIEELQQAVHDQQTVLMKLEKSFKKMNERIEGNFGGDHQVGPGDEKPPHY